MFALHYNKPGNDALLEQLDNGDININLKGAQNYIPTYKRFFSINEKTFNSITLNHSFSLHEVCKTENDNGNSEDECFNKYICNLKDESGKITKKTVFFKFSPLLDPIKYGLGKYEHIDNSCNLFNLPKYQSQCYEKIEDVNNSAYVDTMFSFLTSILLNHHKYSHGLDFYGSFLGVKENFAINIIDEVDLLYDSEYFEKKLNDLFHISKVDADKIQFSDTRNCKKKINIEKNTSETNDTVKLDDVHEINNSIFDGVFKDTTENQEQSHEKDSVLEVFSADELIKDIKEEKKEGEEKIQKSPENKKQSKNNNITTSSSDSCSSRSSETSNSDSDNNDIDSESESDSDEGHGDGEEKNDSEEFHEDDYDSDDSELESGEDSDMDSDESTDCINMIIHNFPVQMIALEKCDNTLDSLMNDSEKEIEYLEWKAIFMQIIMMLLTYQKVFHFTHNDLHTNNIMYVKTEKQFIYYKYNDSYYKVPTYGKLFKLIDFGRAIYKFKGQTFCSDSFHPKGDAATQYNCEPYYNPDKPRVEPNYSFDLCRLACSMFDYFVEDLEDFKKMKPIDDPIAFLISEWCTDDKGRNILYKSNNEERYPDFKLYKMIARKVHNHTPQNQLEKTFFEGPFKISKKKISKKGKIIDIDSMPVYAE
tara:strand:+ start:3318 stop:5261 length:1944 start_codon:yes stop_codon:yes gene_type:complete